MTETKDTANIQPPRPKIKHDWKQTDAQVVITVLVKNAPKDKVKVNYGERSLSLSSSLPDSDSEYSLELDLAHEVIPNMCTHVVTPSKIEVKLRKKEGLRWTQLDGDRQEDNIKAIPQEADILDTRNLKFEGDFDKQVEDILSFVRLTADKVHNLEHLFDDLKHALKYVAPGCVIEPFGSVVTGLRIKTSDVDCYVALPNGEQSSVTHICRARNIFNRNKRKFTQVIAITSAKVPIVKFFHIPTQTQCDVNFKSPAGVRNSKLIAFLLAFDKRALPLAVLIKYWSKIHKFTGTNLMSNYTLIMMVIFYLQVKKIVPSVYELQRNVPSYYVESWNTAFDDSMSFSEIRNVDTLYDLMGGFFKYYSTFNFMDNIISPFMGRVISKKSFDNFEIPEEFSLYKEQVSADVRKKMKTDSKICIQDPFDHSKNCSLGIFDRLSDRIISLFQFASKKFEEEQSNNVLRAIFTEDPNTTAPGMAAYEHQNQIKKQNRKQRKKAARRHVDLHTMNML